MRSFLGNRKVKEQILLFDAESLSTLALSKVEALVKDKPECFDSSSIKRISVACAPLAMWVTANIRYAKVLEQVKPLQAELSKTEDEVELLSCNLESLGKQLDELEGKVGFLKTELELAITKVTTLKRDSESLNFKLQSSRLLLSMLKGRND
jgi:dynein heavy chain 2